MKKLGYILFFYLLLSNQVAGQDCGNYVVKQANSGLEAYQDQAIQDAACELSNLITVPDGFEDFKIYSYDFYTPLAYAEPDLKFELSYKKMEEDLEDLKYYLAIVREHIALDENFHRLGDREIRYVVRLKLPDVNMYDSLLDIHQQAIAQSVENKLNEGDVTNLVDVDREVEGIELLKTSVDKYLINSDDLFEDLGFTKFFIPDDINITRGTNEVSQDQVGQNLLIEYGSYLLNDQSIKDLLSQAEEGSAASMDMALYISGKEQVTDDILGFNSMFTDYESDNSKLKLFLFFSFNTELNSTAKSDEVSNERDSEERFGYLLTDNNLSDLESEQYLDSEFESTWEENTSIEENVNLDLIETNCDIDVQFGRKCIYNYCQSSQNLNEFGIVSDFIQTEAAFVAGVVDGILGTLKFIYDCTNLVGNALFTKGLEFLDTLAGVYTLRADILAKSGKWVLAKYESFKNFIKSEGFSKDDIDEIAMNVSKMAIIGPGIFIVEKAYVIGKKIISSILDTVGQKFYGELGHYIAYQLGVLASDAILTGVSGGVVLGVKTLAKGSKITKGFAGLLKNHGSSVVKMSTELGKKIESPSAGIKTSVCGIGRNGCFVKDTPVLMANTYQNTNQNRFKISNAKSLAVAAAMPIVAVPIQDVQLLDYAVAHETVNSTYGLTASTNDDIYLELMDKDPYTSDQQRERDEYEINDTDWNEVVFEEVHGGSKAKLALHNDWINQKGYQVDAVVEMNLPEQGISGPFRITSIKHIIPQKKPTDEDESDNYGYKPVTALFTHESNQVYTIDFDNGESLGVTYQHPIFSTTAGDWKLAGELEIGEEVLSKSGNTKVVSSTEKEGSETVYNLEVQELHNFLVGESGVVVHNNYNIAEAIVTAIKAAIPAAFKKYGKCKEFAKALRTQLKANGVQNPKCYVAKVVDSQGKRVNVQLWHNGEKIADNGIHVFTPVNNKVFDNINHNGLETSLLDYTKVDYGGTGVGFETQFAHGYDVVFREVKQTEDILKIND